MDITNAFSIFYNTTANSALNSRLLIDNNEMINHHLEKRKFMRILMDIHEAITMLGWTIVVSK